MNDFDVKGWRVSVLAELVWTVLPHRERAKEWEDIAAAAVYEYERRIDEYQDGDSVFMKQKDDFINKSHIYNRRHEIRAHLEADGRYIAYTPRDGNIFKAETQTDIEQFLTMRQNRMAGMVNGYKEKLETAVEFQPDIARTMTRFDEITKISSTPSP